jgi:hypothetical protein
MLGATVVFTRVAVAGSRQLQVLIWILLSAGHASLVIQIPSPMTPKDIDPSRERKFAAYRVAPAVPVPITRA